MAVYDLSYVPPVLEDLLDASGRLRAFGGAQGTANGRTAFFERRGVRCPESRLAAQRSIFRRGALGKPCTEPVE